MSMDIASHSLTVRVLVPRQTASGGLEFRVETKHIRLPLRREDRHALAQRLNSDV